MSASLVVFGPLSRRELTSIRLETALYRTLSSFAEPIRGDGIGASIFSSSSLIRGSGWGLRFRRKLREDFVRTPDERDLRGETLKDAIARMIRKLMWLEDH